MAQQQPGNFGEDFAGVLFSPQALIAWLVLAGMAGGQAVLVTARLAALAASIGYAAIGLLMTWLALLQGIVALAVLFFLSRMLGSADGSAGKANGGAWFGFALLYLFAVWIANAFAAGIAGIVAQQSPMLVGIATGLVALVTRVCLFPLLVRLVSLAHDRNGPDFSEIWDFLTNVRPELYGGYAGLAMLLAFLPMIGMLARLGSPGGMAGAGVYLAVALATSAGQIVLLSYAVATYRFGNRGSGDTFS